MKHKETPKQLSLSSMFNKKITTVHEKAQLTPSLKASTKKDQEEADSSTQSQH